MKKLCVIAIVACLIGLLIGLCLPIDIFNTEKTVVFNSTQGTFWDWTLRVLGTLGTLLAVFVALFKELLLKKIYRPSLSVLFDSTFNEDTIREGNTYVASKYYKLAKIINNGNREAEDCKLYLESVKFQDVSRQWDNELLPEPKLIRWRDGDDKINIPQKGGSKHVCLFELQRPVQVVHTDQKPIGPNYTIANVHNILDQYCNGFICVQIRVEAKDVDPFFFSFKMQWDGIWKDRKEEMKNDFHIINTVG